MIEPKLGFVLTFVENPHQSEKFYSRLLGLDPIEQSPTFVMFALPGGVMLGLWSKYTAEPRVEGAPGGQEICFAAENVDEVYDQWGRMGVTMAQKPTDMDFGRTFVALDPDGHRIRVYRLHERES